MLNKIIAIGATTLALAVGVHHFANAMMAPPPVVISPCGSSIGVCGEGGGGGGGSSVVCESNSWSDDDGSSGSTTACADLDTGSGLWYITESGDGYSVTDWGSTDNLGGDKWDVISGSSDTSSSGYAY